MSGVVHLVQLTVTLTPHMVDVVSTLEPEPQRRMLKDIIRSEVSGSLYEQMDMLIETIKDSILGGRNV
jgi:hypothetical protein